MIENLYITDNELRVFAVSDLHVDYDDNFNWINSLSSFDYKQDILIVAGDISDNPVLVGKTFSILKKKFRSVSFVPGNHDLWVRRNRIEDSFKCFNIILDISNKFGVNTEPVSYGRVTIVPLFGWYDYSFGPGSDELREIWLDYRACVWNGKSNKEVTDYFTAMNNDRLSFKNDVMISFSHFLPRIDLMPSFIPSDKRIIYPALGTNILKDQIGSLKPDIHVYGHSHVNVQIKKDGILFVNNAYGYPHEKRITAKKLICIHTE